MCSLSLYELLLLLALAGVVALIRALIRGGRLRAALMRLGERAAFRQEVPAPSAVDGPAPRGLRFTLAVVLAAPASITATMLYGWFAFLGAPLHSHQVRWTRAVTESAPLAALLLSTLSILLWLGLLRATYLQFQPNHDRRRKYAFLFMWASSQAIVSWQLYIDLVGVGVDLRPHLGDSLDPYAYVVRPAVMLILLFVLSPALVLLALDLLTGRWRDRRQDGISLRLLRLHAFLRRTAVPVVFFFSPHPLLIAYLMMRYHVVDLLAEHPIVYLRSFRHAAGPTAFGLIVAKAARPNGVVTAIVHDAQRGSALLQKTSVVDEAIVARVPDEGWQRWVRERLARASAVIVDTTVATEGVAWELAQAVATVPRRRIAVLVQEGASCAVPEDIFRLEYALDRRRVKLARLELARWLSGAIRSAPPATPAAPPDACAGRAVHGSEPADTGRPPEKGTAIE